MRKGLSQQVHVNTNKLSTATKPNELGANEPIFYGFISNLFANLFEAFHLEGVLMDEHSNSTEATASNSGHTLVCHQLIADTGGHMFLAGSLHQPYKDVGQGAQNCSL